MKKMPRTARRTKPPAPRPTPSGTLRLFDEFPLWDEPAAAAPGPADLDEVGLLVAVLVVGDEEDCKLEVSPGPNVSWNCSVFK